jgi:hypothetical protein
MIMNNCKGELASRQAIRLAGYQAGRLESFKALSTDF